MRKFSINFQFQRGPPGRFGMRDLPLYNPILEMGYFMYVGREGGAQNYPKSQNKGKNHFLTKRTKIHYHYKHFKVI